MDALPSIAFGTGHDGTQTPKENQMLISHLIRTPVGWARRGLAGVART